MQGFYGKGAGRTPPLAGKRRGIFKLRKAVLRALGKNSFLMDKHASERL
jgi:hypothetical protein